MPNIATYENTLEGPQPTDRGSSAFAMEGRRVGQFYHQVGADIGGTVARIGTDIQNHDTHVELMQQAADISTAHAELVQQANQIAATTKPEDVEKAMDDFREKVVKPRLDALGAKYQTEGAQDTFIRARAGIEDDLFTRTSTDAARSVAAGAVANVQTMGNQWSSAALADPTGFDNYIKLSDLYIDGLVHPPGGGMGLPIDQALILKKEVAHNIARSAGLGMARSNPAAFADFQKSGKLDPYLTGEEQSSLVGAAAEYGRADAAAQRAAEAETRRQQTELFNNSANQIVAEATQPDGTFTVSPDLMKRAVDASMLPGGADSGAGRAFLDFMHRAAKPEAITQVSDPATYAALRSRTDPNSANPLTDVDLRKEFAGGRLSPKDYNELHSVIKPGADPTETRNRQDLDRFIGAMKPAIIQAPGFASNPQATSVANRQFYNFQIAATNAFNDGIKAGYTPDEMLRDVKSKHYIGNIVPQYLVTQDKMFANFDHPERVLTQPPPPAALAGKPAAPVKPGTPAKPPTAGAPGQPHINPGESVEDFAARLRRGGK